MRFGFGKNWQAFLGCIDDARIASALESLQSMLGVNDLSGKRFIDIGSGSGLFSLAAHKLGAEVFSFDYDSDSVRCTQALKDRYARESSRWIVQQGSVLDADYLSSLGKFDVVYSWGVLHHTGQMWQALANVAPLVAGRGLLFIAIYNDQGLRSKLWRVIKQLFNAGGPVVQWLLLTFFFAFDELSRFVYRLLSGKNPFPWAVRAEKRTQARGMTIWYDLVDWVGGYPFEVAKPEEIFSFYRSRGFQLERLVTKRGGIGCCEYVFSLPS